MMIIPFGKKRFNSTMVRLKGDLELVHLRNSFVFQFHNGSIKSDWRGNSRTDRFEFQFHNGSIKRSVSTHRRSAT